jgi:hypothetical protein
MIEHNRRGAGRTEAMIGVAVLALIALVAVPLGVNMSKKSKRNELVINVESLRTVVVAHHDAFQEYVNAAASPRPNFEVNGTPQPWNPSQGFQKLSWAPEQPEVFGSYSVTVTSDGFKIIGTSDIDEDGIRAIVEASTSSPARLVTDDAVY